MSQNIAFVCQNILLGFFNNILKNVMVVEQSALNVASLLNTEG